MSAEDNGTSPERRVRSFVRRQGHFTDGQRRALEQLWPRFGLDLASGCLDLHALFPACKRFVLEIGFGSGDTLVELAMREPATGFIGVDVHQPGVGRLLAGLDRAGLSNVRVYCADVVDVLRVAIPDAALDAALMFFPDPWPKKRHHKRRLLQPAFAERVRQKLKPGGLFHLATDVEDYAQQMLEVLSALDGFENAVAEGAFAPRPDTRPETRFERRGLRLGHEVRDLLFRRR